MIKISKSKIKLEKYPEETVVYSPTETLKYFDKTTFSFMIERIREVKTKHIASEFDDEKRAIIFPGNRIRIPEKIMQKLHWKMGDKVWFEIVDEEIPTIEVGKIASSAEDIKKAMNALIKDD